MLILGGFKQKMRAFEDIKESDQLLPELQLVVDNYEGYYEKYAKSKDEVSASYFALRIAQLEKWVENQAGYDRLIDAIDKVRTRQPSQSIDSLNYMGILSEDEKIQASENFYGMLFLMGILSLAEEDIKQQKRLLAQFREYFIYDEKIQSINIKPISTDLNPKQYAEQVFDRLSELASGKVEDIFEMFKKKYMNSPRQSDTLNQGNQPTRTRLISGVNFKMLVPTWFGSPSNSRRVSRSSSSSNTINSSGSNSSLSGMAEMTRSKSSSSTASIDNSSENSVRRSLSSSSSFSVK